MSVYVRTHALMLKKPQEDEGYHRAGIPGGRELLVCVLGAELGFFVTAVH